MARWFLKLTVVAGVLASPASAERRPFTPADLLSLERLSEPQLSPDERFLTYAVSVPNVGANNFSSRIEILEVGSNRARTVGTNAGSDSSPRWSPDGKGLYFLSGHSGSMQVWFTRTSGEGTRRVTDLPLDVNTFRVSPDGKRLLASIEVYPDCPDLSCSAARLRRAQTSSVKAQVYDRLFVRHWDRWKDGRQSHLFSMPLEEDGRVEAAPVDLTRALDADVPTKPWGSDQDYDISPDSLRVAFTARIKGKNEAWSTNTDVFEVDIKGDQKPVNLTTFNPASDAEPKYSPDGRRLAWKAMDRPGHWADRYHLMLKELVDGKVRALAGDWDRSVHRYDFAKDGRSVFATTDHLGQHALWNVSLASGQPKLVVAQGSVTDFAVGQASLIYGLSTIDAPVNFYRTGPQGRTEQLTHLNSARLGVLDVGSFEQFSFEGWNGEKVYGFVVKPVGYVIGRKYPIAFLVHGGPQVSFGNGWSYRWNPQIYAGAGFATVLIDFHGSTGYGQRFTDSITGDWGGKPVEDLRLGLAAAISKYPWMDGENVCGLGASYSGYMMNLLQSAWPERFRCVVNQSGVFDKRTMYYETDELWLPEYEFGGTHFASPQRYEKSNPILDVGQWRTPMLVGHGLQDFNVPLSQGVEAFTALQRRGIPSKFIMFPDEGHFIAKPGNALLWQTAILDWLHLWLGTGNSKSEPVRTSK